MLLLGIALLGNLVCITHDWAYAQTSIAPAGLQSPPHALNRQAQSQQAQTQYAQAEPQQAAPSANDGNPAALRGPEQRVALVIGNSNYQNAPQLANPDHDAQSMAQFLNQAGFEVIAATDLTQNDMIKVMQDFSAKVAARGPNTVAMIYYAGHGVQLAGENYLVPVDARISSPSDLVDNAVRLVDVMATLETIPSRMRIVVLDACRNNPFPSINDAGRGLAIVDAPNGSIVGYSTAPGTEALDGAGGHSPYAEAFLRVAREPNVPIEQLFKRVRLEVNHSTDGQQTPWESSSLTSDFYFFGETAVAATRAPNQGHLTQVASNLPGRSVRQAYDYVLAEDRPEYYQEFIEMFPGDPLCLHIRGLLAGLLQANAWHKAVLANTPLAYKDFYETYGNSPYAQSALKLQSQPKIVPLMQPTHLIVPEQLVPTLKLTNLGGFKTNPVLKATDVGALPHGGITLGDKTGNSADGKRAGGGTIVHLPPAILTKPPTDAPSASPTKIVTLPGQGSTTLPAKTAGGQGKIVMLPPQASTPPTTPLGRPGKIVVVPPTNVGTTGVHPDGNGDGQRHHVIELPTAPRPQIRSDGRDEPRVLRLNPGPARSNLSPGNPSPGNLSPGSLPRGNSVPAKIGGATAISQPPHVAQSTGVERSALLR